MNRSLEHKTRSNIVIFPSPQDMHNLATLFARLCANSDWAAEVDQCKFISPKWYCQHTTPAIIYLYTDQPSERLLDHLQSNLAAISKVDIGLKGANKIRAGMWFTQLTPSDEGCQPISRSRIVLLSFFLSPEKQEDDQQAIENAAMILGYSPTSPDKLAEETAAFRSLVHFVEVVLDKNLSRIETAKTTIEIVASLTRIPKPCQSFNLEACEKVVMQLLSKHNMGRGARQGGDWKSLDCSDVMRNEGLLFIHRPTHPTAQLSKGCRSHLKFILKPEYVHEFLALLATPPADQLATQLRDLSWMVTLEGINLQNPTPVLVHFRASCSPKKLHALASLLREHMEEKHFLNLDIYQHSGQKALNNDWADIAGYEKHSKGMSIAQSASSKPLMDSPFVDFVTTAIDVLKSRKTIKDQPPLRDLLAHQLFVNKYQMHHSARARPDLEFKVVREIDTHLDLPN